MEKGKVWLVGAGPGDAQLLTLKAKSVIEQADTVIYDRLVGQSILLMIPAKAKAIDVGKRAGNHTMPQEEINQLILKESLEGKKVVRLKGGDPFLFGRGGEELELLVKNKIPFEVVPGITSALSVPAYNGIPVTHRDYTSSLHIITGHKKQGEAYNIDFEALVRTKGTLVFLMGVNALEEICIGLINAGLKQETPAAVLEKGTTSKQKKVIATVATLAKEAANNQIGTPAIIVVGEVCKLSNEFTWFEKLPLSNCKVVLTRPADLISETTQKLRNYGAEVLEIPTIKLEQINGNNEIKNHFKDIEQYNWLVLTSPSGANIFFNLLKEFRIDIRKLSKIKIAAIGSATANKIEERGLFVDLISDKYDGKALGEALQKVCQDNDRILIPRALKGGQELIQAIQENKNIIVHDVPTYDTVYEKNIIVDIEQEFRGQNIDYVIFTSSSSVKGFVQTMQNIDFHTIHAVCIGRQTKETADEYGMHTYMAKEATMDSLIEKLIEVAQNR